MSRHRACHLSHPTRQHGVVLFIALIVMVALSLAAIALIRSVDTTNAVVGNLAFRLFTISSTKAIPPGSLNMPTLNAWCR